jgi:hypothetical protein
MKGVDNMKKWMVLLAAFLAMLSRFFLSLPLTFSCLPLLSLLLFPLSFLYQLR